ncbi:SMI1/KNR4 family protein [Streptomyces sp. H39-S7]|uniref:SMI1/KNR4 family protein n=1 Tax=Streptomyces sp. H39-S7 TaxID=3004357 RepID=UPI0022AE6AC0|nr:SMI1/KNR4 family protein [Streptomyces sp. H39-S7]MCZ4121671.1 SMI1/KNR4 family protein [Streptomyces sp. H39-S7]
MASEADFQALMRIMPPHAGAGDVVDWAAVEQGWGFQFPVDYKRFMEVYGGGAIDNYLATISPEPFGLDAAFQGMISETRNARANWDRRPGGQGVVTASSSLVVWGVDASADLLCWVTDGADPDRWPVMVWNQDDRQWTVFNCGMADFLLRMFRAEFDECPLGDLSLWGEADPQFLHTNEEKRLRAAGLDPWTGEPDPFADAEYN